MSKRKPLRILFPQLTLRAMRSQILQGILLSNISSFHSHSYRDGRRSQVARDVRKNAPNRLGTEGRSYLPNWQISLSQEYIVTF